MLHAEEIIRGDPLDTSNPFGFDMVCLNLPGCHLYTPSRPWVFKCHRSTGQLANNFANEDSCWTCARAIASHYSYLGLQDALQKRRRPSQEAGPWVGSTGYTSHGVVTVTVTIDHWSKAQAMIEWISNCVEQQIPMLHKQLDA